LVLTKTDGNEKKNGLKVKGGIEKGELERGKFETA